MDIETVWGIKVTTRKLLPKTPLSHSTTEVINNRYVLKTFPISEKDKLEKEENLLKKLLRVPVLHQLKVTEADGKVYVLYPYIKTERFEYSKENARSLARSISRIPRSMDGKILDIRDEIEKTNSSLACMKKTSDAFNKGYDYLKREFFIYLPYFEREFSHGDLHPGNILWENETVSAIIDWDIAAVREEMYDVAFFLGCIAIEKPENLLGKWVKKFLSAYATWKRPTKLAYSLLPELIISTRLLWLYKWIILEDEEMIALESALIEMLITHSSLIRGQFLGIHDDFIRTKNKWVMQDSWMVEEIDKARERILSMGSLGDFDDPIRLSTDLRLLAIDSGMEQDILKTIKVLSILETLSKKLPDEKHITIERVLAMGNACLDFSRLRMITALKYNSEQIKSIRDLHPEIFELNIGYAFSLRNSSIAFAEAERYNDAFNAIESLVSLSEEVDHKEIKGELARALSNGITTILAAGLDKNTQPLYDKLTALNKSYPDNRKITGAYKIARKNLSS